MVLHEIANLGPSGLAGSIPAVGVFPIYDRFLNNISLYLFMPMVDLEDDKGIERAKQKDAVRHKHIYCSKCGRPKPCHDPECTQLHCNCSTL